LATYEVPDALLETPRTVRCARCAHDWTATPMTATELLEEAEGPGVAFHDRPAAPPVKMPEAFADQSDLFAEEPLAPAVEPGGRRSSLLTVAWIASFAALTLLGVAGYAKRDQLMRHWPASTRVYAMFGLVQNDGQAAGKPGP
jgi:hypothetical protein